MNNILIFGHCGAGKSSLANILANTTLAEEDNESFRTFFDITTITKKTETKEIKDKEKQYRIIDTRGTGSLQESTETAKEIIRALRIANQEEGIKRIILKLRGKIEQNLIEPWEILKLIDENIANYVTLAYSSNKFDSRTFCRKEVENFKNEKRWSEKINQIFQQIDPEKVIFINTPPVEGGESKYEKWKRSINIGVCKDSRKILFSHLEACQNNLKLNDSELEAAERRIENFFEEKRKLEEFEKSKPEEPKNNGETKISDKILGWTEKNNEIYEFTREESTSVSENIEKSASLSGDNIDTTKNIKAKSSLLKPFFWLFLVMLGVLWFLNPIIKKKVAKTA